MGQRRPEGADIDEPVVVPAAAQAGGGFPVAMLAGLLGAVVIAVGLSVFIVMRIIGPQVEQRRIMKEELDQMGETINQIIGSIKQFPLDSTVVNLAGTNAERYLKVTVELGYEYVGPGEDRLGTELTNRRPEIRNQLISILSTKELQDVDSPEGREAIRREILNRVNAMLVSGRVLNVYYTEFVVQ